MFNMRHTNGGFALITIIICLALIVGIVSYVTLSDNPIHENLDSEVIPSPKTQPIETVSTLTSTPEPKKEEIKVEHIYDWGPEDHTISLRLPSDWSMNQVNLREGQGVGGADCYDYVLKANNSNSILQINPVCGDYSGESKPYPTNSEIIGDLPNDPNDFEDRKLVRVAESAGTYAYVNGYDENIQDTYVYSKVFMNIVLTLNGDDIQNTLNIVDQIVKSITE